MDYAVNDEYGNRSMSIQCYGPAEAFIFIGIILGANICLEYTGAKDEASARNQHDQCSVISFATSQDEKRGTAEKPPVVVEVYANMGNSEPEKNGVHVSCRKEKHENAECQIENNISITTQVVFWALEHSLGNYALNMYMAAYQILAQSQGQKNGNHWLNQKWNQKSRRHGVFKHVFPQKALYGVAFKANMSFSKVRKTLSIIC